MTLVDELFEADERAWDVQMVRQNFIGIDADEILKIRPSQTLDEDVIAWAMERSGTYSVRSAYRLLKEEQVMRDRERVGAAAS